MALLSILNYTFFKQKLMLPKKVKEILEDYKFVVNLNQELKTENELLMKKNKLLEKEVIDYRAFQVSRDKQLANIKKAIDKMLKEKTSNILDCQLIRSKIESLTINQDDWLYFKQKIETIYPHFFQSLSLKHPELNKREKMHCAYILMDMPVRQTADSLFLSPKTIESARYRIKKKLGLDKSENLSEYIKQL